MAKFIGFALLLVIVLGFIVPQVFLSSSFASERSTEIAAPRAEVHGVVSDLTTWKEWTVWNRETDPTVEYTYTGDAGQVGQTMSWKGEELGEGSMTVKSVEPGRVGYTLRFADLAPCDVEMLLEEGGDVTRVTWAMTGEMGGMPYMRWMALMMDRLNGPAFEEGLANLKARFEGREG